MFSPPFAFQYSTFCAFCQCLFVLCFLSVSRGQIQENRLKKCPQYMEFHAQARTPFLFGSKSTQNRRFCCLRVLCVIAQNMCFVQFCILKRVPVKSSYPAQNRRLCIKKMANDGIGNNSFARFALFGLSSRNLSSDVAVVRIGGIGGGYLPPSWHDALHNVTALFL